METIDHKEISADYSTRLGIWTGEECDKQRRATVSDAFAILFDAANGPESIVRAVARESFGREHRTLQQAFIRAVVLPILEQLVADGDSGWFDPRNEASVKFAQQALGSYEAFIEGTGERRKVHYVPLPTI